jgi:bacteriocin-like protein
MSSGVRTLRTIREDAMTIEFDSQEISDDQLENVIGGRKAGKEQLEFLTITDSRPPDVVEAVVQWVKGFFK